MVNGYIEKNNSQKAIIYYKKAVENGKVRAMYTLGLYYFNNKKYDEMKEYLLQAIEHKYHYVVCLLGFYFGNNNMFDEMEKYLKMEIDGDVSEED